MFSFFSLKSFTSKGINIKKIMCFSDVWIPRSVPQHDTLSSHSLMVCIVLMKLKKPLFSLPIPLPLRKLAGHPYKKQAPFALNTFTISRHSRHLQGVSCEANMNMFT